MLELTLSTCITEIPSSCPFYVEGRTNRSEQAPTPIRNSTKALCGLIASNDFPKQDKAEPYPAASGSNHHVWIDAEEESLPGFVGSQEKVSKPRVECSDLPTHLR